MWRRISEGLPPEGKEVLFLLVNSKEKALGYVSYFREYYSGEYTPKVAIKVSSTISGSSYEIREMDVVTHWMDVPKNPPKEKEKTIDRFELMDMD